MINRIKKKRLKLKNIHSRVRKKIRGTAARPRLCVYRSIQHIYAQVIDDESGHVLASASSAEKDGRVIEGMKSRAEFVGAKVAERSKTKNVAAVVFDRGGRPYHGNIKVLADKARESGLQF